MSLIAFVAALAPIALVVFGLLLGSAPAGRI